MLGKRNTHMFVGLARRHPSPRSSAQESTLHQKRLIDILDRFYVLADRSRDRFNANRSTFVFLNNRSKHPSIRSIKSQKIYTHHQKRLVYDLASYLPSTANLSKIPHSLE